MIECSMKLHNKAVDERLPLNAGPAAVPIFHHNGVYNGQDNEGSALRDRLSLRF
jgi:hypothetical protein